MQTFAQLEVYRRRADAAFYWGGLILLLALAVLLGALPAFAQTPGAPADPTTADLLELVRFVGGAFKAGMWFAAAVGTIVCLVLALRIYGKKLHELIPDDSIADKPFYFLFDTKPGGVLLNGLTAASVVVTPLMLSGEQFTPAVAGTALLAGVGASQLWGWVKDLYEWWKQRKPDPAPAQAAGLEAAKKPGTGVDA